MADRDSQSFSFFCCGWQFKVPPQIPGRKSVDGVGSDGVGHAKHAREDSPDVSPGFGFNNINSLRAEGKAKNRSEFCNCNIHMLNAGHPGRSLLCDFFCKRSGTTFWLLRN